MIRVSECVCDGLELGCGGLTGWEDEDTFKGYGLLVSSGHIGFIDGR